MTEESSPHSSREAPIVALVTGPGAGGSSLARALRSAGVHVLDSAPVGAPVTSYAEEILAAGQATWWAPPELRTEWMDEPAVVSLAGQQRQAVTEALQGGGVAGQGALWFDERHPLLLDLWRDRPLNGLVLVWDSPSDAVVELRAHGIKALHAAALWEDALQRALAAAVGQRTFVCSRTQLSGSDEVAEALLSFLQTGGVGHNAAGAALTSVLAGHVPSSPGSEGDGRAELTELLESRSGAHEEFASVGELLLSGNSNELLDAHRAVYRLTTEARSAWLLADRADREVVRAEARLTQSLTGVDFLVNHLLNAV